LGDELLGASHASRAPDPQRPLDWLRIFDTDHHVVMIKQGKWDHRRGDGLCPRLRSLDARGVLAFEKVAPSVAGSATANALYSPPWGAKIATWKGTGRGGLARRRATYASHCDGHESAAT